MTGEKGGLLAGPRAEALKSRHAALYSVTSKSTKTAA